MAEGLPRPPPHGEQSHPVDFAELQRKRTENTRRLEDTFKDIYNKYSRDFTNVGDEIDLETGEVIIDNGHLANMEHEHDLGHGQARRFVRAFTANLRDEPIVISDDSSQSETEGGMERSAYELSSVSLAPRHFHDPPNKRGLGR